MARGPQAPGEGGGGQHAGHGEDGLSAGEPCCGEARPVTHSSAALLDFGHHAGDEHEQRRPGGEGVVLLVGGDREKQQSKRGEQAQQPDGAHAEFEMGNVAGHVVAGGVVEIEIDGLAGIATQVLQPAMAGFPGHDESGGQEEAPGEEPDQVEQPVGGEGQPVVVVRVALAEETEEVLVDEVEIPEPVDVAERRVIADGMSLVGIGEAGEDVPGRGDGQVEQDSAEGLELTPAAPLAAEQQQGNGGAGKEDGGDEALGEGGQGQGDPHDVEAGRTLRLHAGEEAIERE